MKKIILQHNWPLWWLCWLGWGCCSHAGWGCGCCGIMLVWVGVSAALLLLSLLFVIGVAIVVCCWCCHCYLLLVVWPLSFGVGVAIIVWLVLPSMSQVDCFCLLVQATAQATAQINFFFKVQMPCLPCHPGPICPFGSSGRSIFCFCFPSIFPVKDHHGHWPTWWPWIIFVLITTSTGLATMINDNYQHQHCQKQCFWRGFSISTYSETQFLSFWTFLIE